MSDTNGNRKLLGVSFQPTITLGTVIQLITILGAIWAGWDRINTAVIRLDVSLDVIEKQIDRIDDRLTYIERNKGYP